MLKDHYLLEDIDMRDEELVKLLKTKTDLISCALEGNFIHTKQLVDQVERSVKILEALHNKKLKRDAFELSNLALYKRRGWVKP